MSYELIFFFDGLCPLCTREVNFLRQKDHKNKILFEDINQKNFEKRYKMINKKEAGKVLHGIWMGTSSLKGWMLHIKPGDLLGIHYLLDHFDGQFYETFLISHTIYLQSIGIRSAQ